MDINIDEMTKTIIESQIIQAFRDSPEAIDELVRSALNQEVNDYGSKPSYSESKMPYLEYAAGNVIRNVATKAVRDRINELQPEIEKVVREKLSSDDLVNSFADNIVKTIQKEWRLTVDFHYEKYD